MSGFSPDWLALREAADHRSRNSELARALAARFQERAEVAVIDVGCGTGSNLRATSPHLPRAQSWTLVDHDPRLLEAARIALSQWAENSKAHGEALVLVKSGQRITVRFREADLASDLDTALGEKPDLVTASALFDLASTDFIKRFANAVARRKAAFYAVLTYNGIQRWKPRHPADGALTAAFHAHQMTDKGFGVSAGPTAAALLADAFRFAGYSVLEGDSPWLLDANDRELIAALAAGFAAAVRETGEVDPNTIDAWAKFVCNGAEVGHTDTLAFMD